MFGEIAGVVLKEGIKAALKPIVFKDGRFSTKRTTLLGLWFVLGWISYSTPAWIRLLPTIPNLPNVNNFVSNLNDDSYLELAKLLFVTTFVAASILAALIQNALRQQNVAALSENEQNVVRFVKDVSLIGGYRCASEAERLDARQTIAGKIGNSKRTKIMLINGYHDLAKPESLIYQALRKKGRSLNLQVLLLDPFSSFAVERAKQLKQETDVYLTRMRYIRDFAATVRSIQQLRQNGAVIEYRTYCSNPFFRMYIFDHDLVLQTYQANKHGNETPLYNFGQGEHSLFHAGQEFFAYYWNRGFLHDNSWLKNMGSALTVYLAQMYELPVGSDVARAADDLRRSVVDFVQQQMSEAASLEEQGQFTDLDR